MIFDASLLLSPMELLAYRLSSKIIVAIISITCYTLPSRIAEMIWMRIGPIETFTLLESSSGNQKEKK